MNKTIDLNVFLIAAFLNLKNSVKGMGSELKNLIFSVKILTISLFIASCSGDRPEIDISDSKLDLKIKRLEQELFTNEKKELDTKDFNQLSSKYGDFFKLYVENIIAIGRASDSNTVYYLNHFRNDLQVKEIALKTLEIFPELSLLEKDFSSAFSRFEKLFPGSTIPEIYSFISAFSYTIVVDDNLMGVGLDMYLGRNQNYYRLLSIPAYKTRNMESTNILADCMRSWLATEFELNAENSDLLSNMIYHGKLLYALDLILPDVADSIKIGFSTAQMKWINENEKDMWFHFAEEDLLYTKDGKQIQKYIGESPFTPGFPEGSPGMTGRWVGWQIVRKYMANTDPLKVKELFNEGDAQKILKLSKYKAL